LSLVHAYGHLDLLCNQRHCTPHGTPVELRDAADRHPRSLPLKLDVLEEGQVVKIVEYKNVASIETRMGPQRLRVVCV